MTTAEIEILSQRDVSERQRQNHFVCIVFLLERFNVLSLFSPVDCVESAAFFQIVFFVTVRSSRAFGAEELPQWGCDTW